MIKYVKGDLLELAERGFFDVIVHGCNCFNTMGAGIAAQIAKKYRFAYEADQATKRGDIDKLGTYSWSRKAAEKTTEDVLFTIINAYTQYHYGKGSVFFDYQAFETVLKTLKVKYHNKTRFGFPLIGCGHAGGDRERVLKILDDILGVDRDVTVVEL